MTSVMLSRSHSGDPAALLSAASRSADVLPIRPKPIRPTACSGLEGRAEQPRCDQSTNTATAAPRRPLGAFSVVIPTPSTSTSMYERELCSLLQQTALGGEQPVQPDHRAAMTMTLTRMRRSKTPSQCGASAPTGVRRPCSCFNDASFVVASALSGDAPLQAGLVLRSPLSDLPAASTRAKPPHAQLATSSRHNSEPLIVPSQRTPSSCSSATTVMDHAEGDCPLCCVAPLATRKRRRKETDENVSETRCSDASCCAADGPDSPYLESGDDDAMEPCSVSPTRADSKCRRRVVVSTLRPSINAEKMLTASTDDRTQHRHNELLLRRSAEERVDGTPKHAFNTHATAFESPLSASPCSTYTILEHCNALEWNRLVTVHASFSMAESLLTGTYPLPTMNARPSSDEKAAATSSDASRMSAAAETSPLRRSADTSGRDADARVANSNSNSNSSCNSNADETQSEELDAQFSLLRKSADSLPTFAPHCASQFHVISELDIDQIENN